MSKKNHGHGGNLAEQVAEVSEQVTGENVPTTADVETAAENARARQVAARNELAELEARMKAAKAEQEAADAEFYRSSGLDKYVETAEVRALKLHAMCANRILNTEKDRIAGILHIEGKVVGDAINAHVPILTVDGKAGSAPLSEQRVRELFAESFAVLFPNK